MAAYEAVKFLQSGMVLGLGTGSTVKHAVARIGELLKQGTLKNIVGILTSITSSNLLAKRAAREEEEEVKGTSKRKKKKENQISRVSIFQLSKLIMGKGWKSPKFAVMKEIVTSKAIKQHKEELLNPNKMDLTK